MKDEPEKTPGKEEAQGLIHPSSFILSSRWVAQERLTGR